MSSLLHINEDWLITLSVGYGIGAVVSLWLAVCSPHILAYWDTPRGQKKKGKRDWSTVFLVFLLLQPFTFTGMAIGMWWVNFLAFIPPVHFLCTFLSFLAIDFFRDDDDLSSVRYTVL